MCVNITESDNFPPSALLLASDWGLYLFWADAAKYLPELLLEERRALLPHPPDTHNLLATIQLVREGDRQAGRQCTESVLSPKACIYF